MTIHPSLILRAANPIRHFYTQSVPISYFRISFAITINKIISYECFDVPYSKKQPWFNIQTTYNKAMGAIKDKFPTSQIQRVFVVFGYQHPITRNSAVFSATISSRNITYNLEYV